MWRCFYFMQLITTASVRKRPSDFSWEGVRLYCQVFSLIFSTAGQSITFSGGRPNKTLSYR